MFAPLITALLPVSSIFHSAPDQKPPPRTSRKAQSFLVARNIISAAAPCHSGGLFGVLHKYFRLATPTALSFLFPHPITHHALFSFPTSHPAFCSHCSQFKAIHHITT
jgi:hypothetical protein